jgi:predicted ester cyclase
MEDVIADGDKVVYSTTIQKTSTGVFLGTPPRGKFVKVNDFTLLWISNEKLWSDSTSAICWKCCSSLGWSQPGRKFA